MELLLKAAENALGINELTTGNRKDRRNKEMELKRKLRQLQSNYIELEKRYQEDMAAKHEKLEAELKEALSNDLSGTFYLLVIKAIREVTGEKSDRWGRARIIELLDRIAGHVNDIENGRVTIEQLSKEVEEDVGLRIEFSIGKRKYIESMSFEKER